MAKKIRLDALLVNQQLVPVLDKAKAMIMAGDVYVNEQLVFKPSELVLENSNIRLKAKSPFVSRGGLKLQAAIETFGIEVNGRTCVDVGCSTGGFTDLLLQKGAAKVYAIDVASGELDWKLRSDPRVIVLEKTNANSLEGLVEKPSLAVIDVSLISAKDLTVKVSSWLEEGFDIVLLLKPQYEATREQLPKGAVILETSIHTEIIQSAMEYFAENNLCVQEFLPSPTKGRGGNQEFLLWIKQD